MSSVSDVTALLDRIDTLILNSLPRIRELRFERRFKPDSSPVTAADFLVEDLVREALLSYFGRVQFIGEESFDAAAPASREDWIAVVDPIDGTENFTSGLKEWGTAISLWHRGSHVASLITMPELGDRLLTGDRPQLQTSRVTGFSSSITPELVTDLSTAGEARIMGCAVYNLYNVSRGAFARFTNPKGAYTWDMLAGLVLAQEQGCDVTVEGMPYDGRYLEPDRRYRFDIRHRYDLHPR
ncbi:MAG: inositol monophosphatase [Devosia sp.]|nr:inositol monophosphatase [Devosia sp.]